MAKQNADTGAAAAVAQATNAVSRASKAVTTDKDDTDKGQQPKRFTIKQTYKSGPVKTYAGVSIDAAGVGTCDLPGSAYHCVLEGYEVLDALNDNKPYSGSAPAGKPVNG